MQDDRKPQPDSEAKLFRLLAENVKDYAIFMIDRHGRVHTWTEGAERLLGYSGEEIIGQPAEILFTPEDVALNAPQHEMQQALASGRGEDDRWHVRKDGSRFWSSGVVTPLWDEDGELHGFAKIMRDRTDWKQAEQARIQSEASKAAVLETALDGIITIDSNSSIVEFNPAAERLLGYQRSDVLGKRMSELIIPPSLRSRHEQGMQHYLATGEGPVLGKRLELLAMRADGSEFPVELAITRVPTDDAVLFTGYLRDITQRKMQEHRRTAQLKVTQVLATSATIEDAASPMLQAVCDNLDWDVGGFWLLDEAQGLLRCLEMCSSEQLDVREFEKASRQRHFALGTGLPGRVAADAEPKWIIDVTQDEDFPRLASAARAGLHTAFAVPLMFGTRVLGVVEFLSRSVRRLDTDLLEMLAVIGGQIGQFVERKRAESALRESEERFRSLVEQAPFSVQILSPDGYTLKVNEAWENLWGVTPDQIGDYNVLEDPQLAEKNVATLLQRAFAGEPVEIPPVHYDPNETAPGKTRYEDPRRWVSAVAYPIKNGQGEVREVVLVHDDITSRKAAEDALRTSEERFRGIVSHSIAGVAEVDLEGRFLFANDRYQSIVGRSLDELLGLRMQDISHPDDLKNNLPLFERMGRDGLPYIIEKRYIRPDGSTVWVNNSVSGLRGPDGKVKSIVAVCVDVTARRRAEEAHREGEERLRTLIDNLPHGAVYRASRDPKTGRARFLFLSAGVERIFGISAEEGVADPALVYEAIHEDDRRRVLEGEAAALQKWEQFDAEFRVRHRSGELRWLHCRSAPHRLPSGEVVWEGVLLDVTDRRLAERNLRDQEHRLGLALAAGKMGTWQWDIPNERVHWSTQLEEIHGLAPGEFPGTFEAYQHDIHPEDRERVLSSLQQTLQERTEHHIEYRVVRPDGTVHWIEARGKLFCDEEGQPLQIIGVCTEITERKRSEQDLRFLAEASRSLASLVDHGSTLQRIASLAVPDFADWCSIYLPEEEGKLHQLAVAHVDPSKVRLTKGTRLRWPVDADAPKSIYEVFRTGRSELIEEVSESMLRAAVENDEHFEMLRALGLRSYICVPMTVREQAIGVMTFVTAESGRRFNRADLALAEDLARRAAIASENARLYATLREEGRRKDEFLAMLAHELRNPLAPIRSGLDLLDILGTDREILVSMQQQVEHLVRLVDDLLDVSRIMRGKIELRRETIDLRSIIERATETARPLIKIHGHRLETSLPAEPILLHADPVRMAQVIGNLLNNAAKYTPAGGHIAITARRKKTFATISVRDSGVGIDGNLLPHVFDLFRQSERSIDRSQGGLGIGLTVVRSLVEMHGGTVKASSPGSGHGSEFIIELPLSEKSPDRKSDDRLAPATRPYRILVVDDNIAAANMLKRLLEALGEHRVTLAHDGDAAIAAAESAHPDIILLDIGLPKLDGYEVARRLRRRSDFEETLIVALTGYGTEHDRRMSIYAGCDEHLVKPPGVDTLRSVFNHPKLTP